MPAAGPDDVGIDAPAPDALHGFIREDCGARRLEPAEAAVLRTIVVALLGRIETAVAFALVDLPRGYRGEDALCTASAEVLTDIVAGVGVMPRDELLRLGWVMTAYPTLRDQATEVRVRTLTAPLAHYLGLHPEDPDVAHALLVWSVVVAASYNQGRYSPRIVDPLRDGRVPEAMVPRLRQTFGHITGRVPPDHGAPRADRPAV